MAAARQAEDDQSAEMRPPETLVSFMAAAGHTSLPPEGKDVPPAASKQWLDLLAERHARASSTAHLRCHLTALGEQTRQHGNRLTHTSNVGPPMPRWSSPGVSPPALHLHDGMDALVPRRGSDDATTATPPES